MRHTVIEGDMPCWCSGAYLEQFGGSDVKARFYVDPDCPDCGGTGTKAERNAEVTP